MKRLAALASATTIAIALIACSSPPVDAHDADVGDTHNADVKAIRDTESQRVQDYANKNTSKIIAHYTDDAVLKAPGMAPSSGTIAISRVIKQMISDPTLSLKFRSSKIEVAKSGDIGFTQGTYTMEGTDARSKKAIHDQGSYVTIYRKQPDGSWKAAVDIATSVIPTDSADLLPPSSDVAKPKNQDQGQSQIAGTRQPALSLP
jgi:ketosteroid isomerase-like protein